VIRLTDTDLSLRSIRAFPRRSPKGYLLSGGRFRLGGSEYVVTLNAIRSYRRGSHLLLTFAR
jgi:hypothetical protein